MSKLEAFLSSEEETEIVETIQSAEKHTSGEIRVHIEHTSNNLSALNRANEVFHFLKMDTTELRNGVLIYVAVNDKTFAIYGDKGIDNVVSENFWNSTKDKIQSHFKNGNFKQGLIDGIIEASEQLKIHFPWKEGDTDELTNEISKG